MQTAEMAALRFSDLPEAETLGSGTVDPPLPRWKVALLVAAGGGLGAALRLLVTVAMPTVTTPTLVEVPWATLWVNVIGCLGLGALVGVLEIRPGRAWMRPLLGTGLCGGFTTMSAVVLEGSAMIGAEFPIPALAYAVATVVLCLSAVAGGFVLGRRLARRARRAPVLDNVQDAATTDETEAATPAATDEAEAEAATPAASDEADSAPPAATGEADGADIVPAREESDHPRGSHGTPGPDESGGTR